MLWQSKIWTNKKLEEKLMILMFYGEFSKNGHFLGVRNDLQAGPVCSELKYSWLRGYNVVVFLNLNHVLGPLDLKSYCLVIDATFLKKKRIQMGSLNKSRIEKAFLSSCIIHLPLKYCTWLKSDRKISRRTWTLAVYSSCFDLTIFYEIGQAIT